MPRAKKKSRADGKRFGTTTIDPAKSQFEIQQVLRKYGVDGIQWTMLAGTYTLRFLLDGRSYVMRVTDYADDPQETRRLFRVVYWYLDTMLAALDSELFTAKRVLLPWLEVAPELALADVMDDESRVHQLRSALGGQQLALEGVVSHDGD